MKFVGRINSVCGSRILILRCDAAQLPRLQTEVTDRRLRPVGKLVDLFGNIKAPRQPVEMEEEDVPVAANIREPLADVIEENDEIVVVVELPGVKKEDITLDANEDSIEIRADGGKDRKYQKNVWLPSKINPDKAKARYTNGILEVRLEKVEEKRTWILYMAS